MKKILIATMVVLTVITMSGCISNDSNNSSKNNMESTIKNAGYSVVINGTEISIDEEADEILAKLGPEKEYFESQSCAFPGLDKVYTYNNFEISTYPKDDKDYIAGIFFLDDTVETKEGIYLYQTLDDVIKTYGNNYTEDQGIYSYVKGKTKLSFMIKDNKIVQIEYRGL